jgi:hypothetical protein
VAFHPQRVFERFLFFSLSSAAFYRQFAPLTSGFQTCSDTPKNQLSLHLSKTGHGMKKRTGGLAGGCVELIGQALKMDFSTFRICYQVDQSFYSPTEPV